MEKKGKSRLDFIKSSSLAGFAAAVGLNTLAPFSAKSSFARTADMKSEGTLSFQPRYHRWHVDPGVEWLETNTGYATLDWTIPVFQTALVLVDVWQRHYIKETEEIL